MSESILVWGLLFSSIGFAFALYGKQQRAVVPLLCGIALMVYPYFVPNVIALVVIGIVLMGIPYLFRR
jgi:hypothetical protein